MALFSDVRHGIPPAGGVDLNRDPGLPGRDPGVRPAQLHGPELAVRAPQWLWASAAGLELEPAARTSSRPGNNPAATPLALFCARPQERIDDAVNQGLSILAGLALGGSSGGRGQGEP